MKTTTLCILAIAVLAAVPAAFAGPEEELERIEKEIVELRRLAAQLLARLDAVLARLDALKEGSDTSVPEPEPSGPEGTWVLDRGATIDALVEDRVREEAEDLGKLSPEERRAHIADIREEAETDVVNFHLGITLQKGGTFTAEVNVLGSPETARGTWVLTGTRITLVATHAGGEESKDPSEISGVLDDATMTLRSDDLTLVLRRK